MNEDEAIAPFWDHVEELRRLLVRILFIIIAGVACSFFFYTSIIHFFTAPLQKGRASLEEQTLTRIKITNREAKEISYRLPPDSAALEELSPETTAQSNGSFLIPPNGHIIYQKAESTPKLMILGPLEGFSITLKICLWVGIVGTSPFWMFIVLQFILPALRRKERSLALGFGLLSVMCIAMGLHLAYHITIPLSNAYFNAFNEKIGTNTWSLPKYLDYTLFLMLSHAFVFELCAVSLLLVKLRVISEKFLCSHRKEMIVFAFVLGAILTPPDIVTQVMLAIPIILIYEIVILYAKYLHRVNFLYARE